MYKTSSEVPIYVESGLGIVSPNDLQLFVELALDAEAAQLAETTQIIRSKGQAVISTREQRACIDLAISSASRRVTTLAEVERLLHFLGTDGEYNDCLTVALIEVAKTVKNSEDLSSLLQVIRPEYKRVNLEPNQIETIAAFAYEALTDRVTNMAEFEELLELIKKARSHEVMPEIDFMEVDILINSAVASLLKADATVDKNQLLARIQQVFPRYVDYDLFYEEESE